jgi:uncharacterized protein YbjT (DUF2867 family)
MRIFITGGSGLLGSKIAEISMKFILDIAIASQNLECQ